MTNDFGFDAFLLCLLRQENHILLRYLLLEGLNSVLESHWINYLKNISDPQIDRLLSVCEAIKASELLSYSPVKSSRFLEEALKFNNEKLACTLIDVDTDCSTIDRFPLTYW